MQVLIYYLVDVKIVYDGVKAGVQIIQEVHHLRRKQIYYLLKLQHK